MRAGRGLTEAVENLFPMRLCRIYFDKKVRVRAAAEVSQLAKVFRRNELLCTDILDMNFFLARLFKRLLQAIGILAFKDVT